MGKKKLLTLDDLINFCANHNFAKFSSSTTGYDLRVLVPASFDMISESEDNHRGMLRLKVKAFHTGANRNGSYVSEEAAIAAMPTMSYRPILAAIHQLDDGSWDFHAHDVEVDENSEELVYIEKQVGAFGSEDAFFEQDPNDPDKKFICKYAYIPEEYTKACDILRNKNGSKVSVELAIEEMSYSADTRKLNLEKFYVAGMALLGKEDDGSDIEEGMKGSRADLIEDFSSVDNSLIDKIKTIGEQINELNEKIGQMFVKEEAKVNKLNELLEKYSASIEDLPFADEVENMTDEELEAKFAELFESAEVVNEELDESTDDSENKSVMELKEEATFDTPDPTTDPEAAIADIAAGNEPSELGANLISADDVSTIVAHTFSYAGKTKTFEISLEAKSYALNCLVNETYSNDETWYSVECYDTYVIMVDWWNNKAYKQEYVEVEEDKFELVGERVEVFSRWLTEQEIHDLEVLSTNYNTLKADYEMLVNENDNRAKQQIFTDESYAEIYNTEEWKELKANAGKYSVEDLAREADAIYGRFCKKSNNKGKIGISQEAKRKTPYGSLFN